ISAAGLVSAAGGFSGSLAGNASTATKLATARTINGTSFDGSANITIKAAAAFPLGAGTYLTRTAHDGSATQAFAVDATSANTASKVVARDASGNFAANVISVGGN